MIIVIMMTMSKIKGTPPITPPTTSAMGNSKQKIS